MGWTATSISGRVVNVSGKAYTCIRRLENLGEKKLNTSEFYQRQATESKNAALGLGTCATLATILTLAIIIPMAINGQNVIPVSIFCAVPLVLFYSVTLNFYRDAEKNMDNYVKALAMEGDVEDAIERIIASRSVPPTTEA